MIDPAVIKRDAQANIADWPIQIRHYYNATQYVTLSVGLNASDDISQLLPGGLLDDPAISIIAIVDDFKITTGDSPRSYLPRPRDRVDIQMADGSWQQFEVKRVPDYYDELSPTIQFTLGTPDA